MKKSLITVLLVAGCLMLTAAFRPAEDATSSIESIPAAACALTFDGGAIADNCTLAPAKSQADCTPKTGCRLLQSCYYQGYGQTNRLCLCGYSKPKHGQIH